jgi:phenylpropionate dioxygenase-like ring-hydroxylating dioxygenase large terminal subunit
MTSDNDDRVAEADLGVTPSHSTVGTGAGGESHNLGLRGKIPREGLTEYWYPAIPDRRVGGKKPTRRKLLGQDLVFFRGVDGNVVALGNWCPHRNASLAKGKCLFSGTISCPYHGLTLDERGKAVAFLGEGPQSRFVGKPGSDARAYPTQTHKGLVFVWMGEGEPAPIGEDVPPEFFDPAALVMHSEQRWTVNWRASLENLQDAHVYFVHRNSLEMLSQDVSGLNLLLHMGPDRPNTQVVNGRALIFETPRFFDFIDSHQDRKTSLKTTFQDTYPQLGGQQFPKTKIRLYLATVMGFLRRSLRRKMDWLVDDPEWAMGVHLPTTFRLDYQSHIYSRAVTPEDADNSWIFYYTTTYPKTPLRRLYRIANFHLYYDWKQHRNFSGQDKRIVEDLNYENPREKFSTSDTFPSAWRRMVIDHARQPRRAAPQPPSKRRSTAPVQDKAGAGLG